MDERRVYKTLSKGMMNRDSDDSYLRYREVERAGRARGGWWEEGGGAWVRCSFCQELLIVLGSGFMDDY